MTILYLRPIPDRHNESCGETVRAWLQGSKFALTKQILCSRSNVGKLMDSGHKPVIVIGQLKNVFIPVHFIDRRSES